MHAMDVVIFTTGGTIDKVYFDAKGGYQVGAPMVRDLLEHARLATLPRIVELLRKDSLEMSAGDREAIRAAVAVSPESHVIVTHGTDTMVETARVLQAISGKTIVLTGALQPGRFSDSDAAFNLGLAFAALQLCSAGVYVVANGTVFPADRVRKNREMNCFERIPG
jgi:L-asparaginase